MIDGNSHYKNIFIRFTAKHHLWEFLNQYLCVLITVFTKAISKEDFSASHLINLYRTINIHIQKKLSHEI